MKALTCPQCGALIKKVSLKDTFAHCEYCGAKILLEDYKDKIVEISEKSAEQQLTAWQQHQENYRKVKERASRYDAPYTYPQEDEKSVFLPLILVLIGVGAVIFLAANSKSCLSRPLDTAEKTPVKAVSKPTVESAVPTPLPQVNYQVKVQWNGANDMEHFENPQIDVSKLPTTDENELKKTVFKNRAVQVKITIGTDGEVSSAEAISGHPILKEAAVNAARKTVFNPRQKPTNRVLTYYFRLIDE